MKSAHLIISLFGLMTGLCMVSCKESTTTTQSSPLMSMIDKNIAVPLAAKKPKELTIHGYTRQDPYYWLNERENPEVIDYLTAENQYTDTKLAHTKAFQEKLYNELVGRVKQTDMSVPFKDNGYYYITRYEEGQEYPIHSRRKSTMEANEEIMLDVNVLAKGFDYYAVGGRSVSPDNKLLAYSEDTLSRRIYTLPMILAYGFLIMMAHPGRFSARVVHKQCWRCTWVFRQTVNSVLPLASVVNGNEATSSPCSHNITFAGSGTGCGIGIPPRPRATGRGPILPPRMSAR